MLHQKVILITGGCTGIGKSIASACVAAGAKVAINGLEEELGQALVAELGENNACLYVKDITDEGFASSFVSIALDKFGRIDGLVNNAAYIATSDVHSTTTDFFQRMFAVNTIAPFMLIQAALPQLSQNKGCVVNIGSINAWGGEPNLLAYSVSKGALMTLTRNMGDTVFRENGVRINQINPGWVLTEKEKRNKKEQGMKDNWYEDISDFFAPAQRIFNPEEIAAFATFLLSDVCGPISSQVFDLEQFPMIGRNLPKDITISRGA